MNTCFIPATPTGVKVKCAVCGSTGYGPTNPGPKRAAAPWQRRCLEGHPALCSCGRRFTKGGIGPHIGAMLRHHPASKHYRVTGAA